MRPYVKAVVFVLLAFLPAEAVTTEFLVDDQAKDFKAGEYENIVISNLGRIQLSLKSDLLLKDRKDVSAVFAIGRLPDGTIVAGTGPKGQVLKFHKGKWQEVFKTDQPYVFSLLVGKTGKMYIGTAGSEGKVYEITPDGKSKLIFHEKGVRYIWALTLLKGGKLLAATGPTGKVFQIDKTGAKCIFTCPQKNIIAMAPGLAGRIYLGTDTAGVVYVLDPDGEKYQSWAVFDAPEDQISALAVDRDGIVYFGTATGKSAPGQARAFLKKPAGTPVAETQPAAVKKATTRPKGANGIAHKRPVRAVVGTVRSGKKPPKGNAIYRLDEMGFVTEIFRDQLDVCWLACRDDRLYAGTWPDGWLLELIPDREEIRTAAKADAKFIYSILMTQTGAMLLATGSPARILQLGPGLAEKGTFTSRALDAGQIARWGKISGELVDATFPESAVTIQTRTSAVSDKKDPAWSKWSAAKPLTRPHAIDSPLARFIQYRVTLKAQGEKSPAVDKVKIPYMQDNQPPQVVSLSVAPPGKSSAGGDGSPGGAAKPKRMKVTWKAVDLNKDKMVYDIYLRLLGTAYWIELEKDHKKASYDWDPMSVPDGNYQFKVVASDRPSNPVDMALVGARVSDKIVVDKTPPTVRDLAVRRIGQKKILLKARLVDELSEIEAAWVRLNAQKDWQYIGPADEIYDQRDEYVESVMDEPSVGAIVIAIKVRDRAGNIGYAHQIVTKPKAATQTAPATTSAPGAPAKPR